MQSRKFFFSVHSRYSCSFSDLSCPTGSGASHCLANWFDIHGLRPGQTLGMFGAYIRHIIPVKPPCRALQRKKGVINLFSIDQHIFDSFGVSCGKFFISCKSHLFTFDLGFNDAVPLRDLGHDMELIIQCGNGGSNMEMMLNLSDLLGFGQDENGLDKIRVRVQGALYLAADDSGRRQRASLWPAGAAAAAREGRLEQYLNRHQYITSTEVVVQIGGLTFGETTIFMGMFVCY